jgi:hypothetical protein
MGLDSSFEIIAPSAATVRLVEALAAHLVPADAARMLAAVREAPRRVMGLARRDGDWESSLCLSFLFEPDERIAADHATDHPSVPVTGRPIVAVAVEPVGHVGDAEHFLAHPRSPEPHLEDVHWIAGRPFTVWVRCIGRTSMSGRELSYSQYKALLVRVDYADGSNRLLWVAIPDGRRGRRVSVLIP